MKKLLVTTLFVFTHNAGAVLASGGGEHGHGIDWMHGLVYPAANFLILAFFLVLFLRKPLINAFRERSAKLKLSMGEARTLYDKAYQQHQEIDTRLKNVDAQSRQLMQEIQSEAEAERKRIVQEAVDLGERIKVDAGKIAEQEVKRAFEAIKAETVRQAMTLARENVKAKLGSQEQAQLGDEFIGMMKAGGKA